MISILVLLRRPSWAKERSRVASDGSDTNVVLAAWTASFLVLAPIPAIHFRPMRSSGPTGNIWTVDSENIQFATLLRVEEFQLSPKCPFVVCFMIVGVWISLLTLAS